MPSKSRSSSDGASKSVETNAQTAEPWVSRTAGLPLSARVQALRDSLIDSIEQEVEQHNVRVILWLADKLKVLDADLKPEKRSTDELRAFFNELNPGELRDFAGLASQPD